MRAFAKISGASNRKMTSTLQLLRVRVGAARRGSPGSLDPTQDRLVRPPGPAEHVEDRQRDGDRDAGQHAEERDPRKAAIDSANSVRRRRNSRIVPGMSASEIDAAITTAASVGCGRFCSRPGTNSRISVMAAAPTTPVICVFAPACSATAVREPLVLTGKPWKKPAAMFAAPIPIISWFAETCWPVRAANAEDVEIVSASDTSAMPSAPGRAGRSSPTDTRGMVKGGKPCGSVPDQRDAARHEVERVTATMDITTTIRTAGTFGSQRCSTRISDQATWRRPPARRRRSRRRPRP